MINRIMLVFGTRPEAIKMAPLVKELQKHSQEIKTIVCVTGQHREMLDQVLQIFEIHPNYDLNIMKQGQDLYDITSRVLLGMRDILKNAKPDVVLVHGDTTTSTAAALAAFYQQIPVGHVEAGLRTHDIYSPWPEEMNRLITSRIATYNFSPTPLSRQNLLDEGVKENSIAITGNTVIDALYWVVDKIKNDRVLNKELEGILINSGCDVKRLNGGKKLVLITGHRRENFGEGFLHICVFQGIGLATALLLRELEHRIGLIAAVHGVVHIAAGHYRAAVDIDAVGLGRRDIAGCAEPRSKADGGVTTGPVFVFLAFSTIFNLSKRISPTCLGDAMLNSPSARV